MQKAIRIIAIVAVVGLLLSLIIYNATKPVDYTPWNEAMTLGNKETAKHHFIMYTDIFCPYCDKFSNALRANAEEFQKTYLEDNNVFFEIRITDSVQHGGTHILYAGEINNHVIEALRALGYDVTSLTYDGEQKMIRIDWTNIRCPDSLVCPKEVNYAKNTGRTGSNDS